jgi:predicted nucleic acid-binding protein
MIPDMRELLERMRSEREDEAPDNPVMKVRECQKAMDQDRADPEPWINWVSLKAGLCESSPLGKQRSHDSTDDILLGCALASGAAVIVSKDKDLLGLGKPFGVEVLTPRQFLGWAKWEDWR